MKTSTVSRLSAGTPKTVDPFAGFWDDARFAEICPTAHAGRDFPGRLVHAHQISKRWPEERSGLCSTFSPKCVGFVDENQPPTRQVDFGEAQAVLHNAGLDHSIKIAHALQQDRNMADS